MTPFKIYEELAPWWPLLSAPGDYAEEAEFYRNTLQAKASLEVRDVLELGCGGGNNASHMKSHFQLTLVDIAPGMVAVSRALNPECEHIEGDMRTVRLDRTFDAVFVHDAVVYMVTEVDLRRVMETAYVHTKPGGAVLFAPDHVRETFRPATDHGGEDGEGRSLRFLEWSWDPDPADTEVQVEYVLVLREGESIRVVHDRHIEGLFPRTLWLQAMRDAGFEAECIPFDHSELEPGTYEVFLGRRPLSAGA